MSSYFHKCSRILGLFTLVVWCCPSLAQTFVYVEPDNPACPVMAVPPAAPPKKVAIGETVAGAIKVGCSFKEGSYTVTLSATDPSAIFSPKTFLVNFGRLAGNGDGDGAFAVKFATAGEQTITATITSNMGSPPVRGRFASSTNLINVARP
jgi:hypothetical protein